MLMACLLSTSVSAALALHVATHMVMSTSNRNPYSRSIIERL